MKDGQSLVVLPRAMGAGDLQMSWRVLRNTKIGINRHAAILGLVLPILNGSGEPILMTC